MDERCFRELIIIFLLLCPSWKTYESRFLPVNNSHSFQIIVGSNLLARQGHAAASWEHCLTLISFLSLVFMFQSTHSLLLRVCGVAIRMKDFHFLSLSF